MRPSRWQQQYAAARAVYASLSEDDILHGYRAQAGLPARLKFRPSYDVPEGYPYFTYFDRKALPWRLW